MNTEKIATAAPLPALKVAEVMPSCLRLPLIEKWFKMTAVGIKKEDYREINRYWSKRFIYNLKDVLLHTGRNVIDFIDDADAYDFVTNPRSSFGFKEFEINLMTLGYPKSSDIEKQLKYKHVGIEVRTGNPEWGAVPNKLYFVIAHGDVIA